MIKILGEVPYYTFSLLSPYPNLRHAVFTRQGPGGADWTFSFNGPQSDDDVLKNIKTASGILGTSEASFVGQVHGTEVLLLEPTRRYHPQGPQDVLKGYDAIIGRCGQTLMIRLADCQGIILFEPKSRTLALAHSGWRGSVQNIIGKTIGTMESELGLKGENILACVTPSLGFCCAEFKNYSSEIPKELHRFRNPANDHFDFIAVTRRQLLDCGIREENIEFSGICTRCDPQFYSYRRKDAGRFALMAGIIQ
ncbi:MAG: polyphenol oxidase family protein [Deltaproteobacteria bacterium]|jgi:YfiH family protein|nr:polyphenol oxidase family protein [Deltaproteobacteria bacterium]